MSTIIRKPTREQLRQFISNQQTILAFEQLFDSVNQLDAAPILSTVADSTAIANTVAATNFSQTASLPAGLLVSGKTIGFKLRALFSTTGSPTYRLRVLLGITAVLDTGTGNALQANATNRGLTATGEITCASGGASGTVIGGMTVSNGYGNAIVDIITASAVSVDATERQALTFEWTWSAASSSNTVKVRQFIVEALN